MLTSSNAWVRATIASGTGGTLGGTKEVNAVNGVATFTNLTLSGTVGTNYTLQFASSGLTSAISGNVRVTAGAATQIAVNAGDNQTAVAGTCVIPPPSVIVKDANNNPVKDVSVTFAVESGGGSVKGTTMVTTNASGIAAVEGWTLGTTAGPNILKAMSGSLTGSPVTFTATGTAGTAEKVLMQTEPVGGASGAALTTQPVVKITDANGNMVTSSNALVRATIASGTGGTLGGTTMVSAVNGVVTFTNLTLTGTVGTNCTLGFGSDGLTMVTSSTVQVTAPLTSIGAISGTATFGQVLTAGALSPSGATATYQWQSSAASGGTYADISGATDKSYTIVSGDIHKFLRVVATGSGAYTGSVTSAATSAVQAQVINITALPGVTAPVKGATPVTTITATDQYTGTVAWSGSPSAFAPLTVYTAKITLDPKSGYTLIGVAANSFTVAGATTVSHAVNSGEVTAAFPATQPLAIGDSYGGGKVAYILQSGDTGYSATIQHGLIAATADQSSGIPWALPAYQSTSVGGTSQAIGTGSANTDKIIAQNGAGATYAAGLARAYNGGSYSDWYLPSKDELNKLYINKIAVGGFSGTSYWSSTESNDYDDSAWSQRFYDGYQTERSDKIFKFCVRAVRTF